MSKREAIAQAIYDELEGEISDQDAKRQKAQWERCLRAADRVLARLEEGDHE